ncbi:MAG: penicillin-binding transpeptidase domain-containing protein [Defluviitaleaceae bacterium]|nr:penicillin-binding transpeptidase domain-containing protein [Defluviitaleaceae bacterium]
MNKSLLVNKKLIAIFAIFSLALLILLVRVIYIQIFEADFLMARAYEQQTRDRLITPNRGSILDRNLVPLATTETVASISVVHNQIEDKELVSRELSHILDMDFDTVMEKVNRRVALERIKTKVDLEIAAQIRALNLSGVVVDEDIERVYPFSNLAASIIGFVGRDNQGIIGLEAKYNDYLKGTSGRILTETDVRGLLLDDGQTFRIAPVDGYTLVTSLDLTIQQYAEQTISNAVSLRNASRGSIIVMNPNDGSIYAMANYPDFDLNDPFTINNEELRPIWNRLSNDEQMNHLNQMWRNFAINDTFEPGSTFKIITGAMGLEEGFLNLGTRFICNGYHMVGGRMVRCWRHPRGHGDIDFLEGVKISCNPVFMIIGETLGAEIFYKYLEHFGLTRRTGIDLAGEAGSIMHPLENVGPVELATMSFGQSFQITSLQLMSSIASIINGGYSIVPHIGQKIVNSDNEIVTNLQSYERTRLVSTETAEIMRYALEQVVYDGTGNKAYIPGFRIGGKTATSEKLPRRSGNYIASIVAFAPAENPTVMAFVLIDEPRGLYYGGQVAGPVMQELLQNILPYLGIEAVYNEDEVKMEIPVLVEIPNVVGLTYIEAEEIFTEIELLIRKKGEGENIIAQFPVAGEQINTGEEVLVFVN